MATNLSDKSALATDAGPETKYAAATEYADATKYADATNPAAETSNQIVPDGTGKVVISLWLACFSGTDIFTAPLAIPLTAMTEDFIPMPMNNGQRVFWRTRLGMHIHAGRLTEADGTVAIALLPRLPVEEKILWTGLDTTDLQATLAAETGFTNDAVKQTLTKPAGLGMIMPMQWRRSIDAWNELSDMELHEHRDGANRELLTELETQADKDELDEARISP